MPKIVSPYMRSDMYKVIIEKPRGGGRFKEAKGYKRAHQRIPLEEMPQRESIGRKWQAGWRSKHQTDVLGPLRRFLRSRVGQPWNKVYSEIVATIDRRNKVQEHLLDHVMWEVETNVSIVDGELWTQHRWRLRPGSLYVCPRTGSLKEVPPRSKKRKGSRRTHVPINATAQYRKIDGIWYKVALRPLAEVEPSAFDVVLKKPVSEFGWCEARTTYGRPVFAVAKQQIGKREIRKLQESAALPLPCV